MLLYAFFQPIPYYSQVKLSFWLQCERSMIMCCWRRWFGLQIGRPITGRMFFSSKYHYFKILDPSVFPFQFRLCAATLWEKKEISMQVQIGLVWLLVYSFPPFGVWSTLWVFAISIFTCFPSNTATEFLKTNSHLIQDRQEVVSLQHRCGPGKSVMTSEMVPYWQHWMSKRPSAVAAAGCKAMWVQIILRGRFDNYLASVCSSLQPGSQALSGISLLRQDLSP